MEEPAWYGEWRHEAVHELQAKNAAIRDAFRLGSWERFDYDLDAGTMTFSEAGVPKVIADIQIAGSTSARAANWLWAWGNPHWPQARVTDSFLVKAFGEENGICELAHDYVDDAEDINALGWELTAVMVRLVEADGAYRPPRDEGGGLYLAYKALRWAS